MDDALTPGKTVVGAMPDGRPIHRVALSDGTLSVALLELGTILQDLRLTGVPRSLTLGTADIAAYQGPLRSCGALIGPVVNRISGAQARIGSRIFRFDANQDGAVTRHSGSAGTNRKLWEIGELSDTAVTFELSLPEGEGGFPGNRVVAARYALTAPGTLEMRVAVTTDAATWVNFANHSYWNLGPDQTFAGHRLSVRADRYCVTGPGDLPTGEIRDVAGTPFDFRDGAVLSPGAGPVLDLNLCLADTRGAPRQVLTLTGPDGVTMRMETTEPGVQIYDAGGLDGGVSAGWDGRDFAPFAGLAIEAQGWPDALNKPEFPSVVLRAGHAYEQVTRWHFSA